MYGDAINQVDSVKYLGVVIDDRLTWQHQLVQIQKVVQGKLAILRRLSNYLPCSLLENIHLSCIQPNLDYADTVWNICGVNGIRSTQKLQNYAARIICKNFDFVNVRGEELVNTLGWQPLVKRRNFHTAVLMYKCINNLAPDYLCDEITRCSEVFNYLTRSANSLNVIVPRANKNCFKKSFSYNGAITWNGLANSKREAEDLITFKSKYKECYF